MRNKIFSSVSHKLLSAVVLAAMVLAALPAKSAYAASTITVTIPEDEFTGVGTTGCSLREAIVLANNNAANANDCTRSAVDNDDIIELQSGSTYTLSRLNPGTNAGDLDIGSGTGTSGNLTIQASGSTPAIIDAADIDRVLDVDAMGNYSLTLINIIVTNGNTTGQTTTAGGGISFAGTGTLTLINSAVTSNVATNAAGCGAGIYNNSAATVVITNSTIDGNTCATAGSDGGGVFKGTGGTLTLTNSTVSNNSTADNGGGVLLNAGTVTITNSTFANNTAGNRGGGIQVGGATVNVEFSTFSGNAANDIAVSGNSGGAVQASSGSATVTTSILANSTTGTDCDKSSTGSVTLTNSLAENKGDCSGTPTSALDPGLGPLTNNGGDTNTMVIGDTSPAYNAAASCGSFTTDQRGSTRPQSGFCDLGAYELQNTTSPTVLSVVRGAETDPTTLGTVHFTVTFSESVSGVSTDDFSLTNTGTANGSVNAVSAGPSATYTVTVTSVIGNGTMRLDVLDDDTIIDGDLNPLDGVFTNGEFYTIDNVVPSVVSITREDETNPTNAATVDFGVVFSEAVTGVDTGDFLATVTGAITGYSVSAVNGLGNTYTVTVNTGSDDGTIRLDLKPSGTGISDVAGNFISGGFTGGEAYSILKSVPYANVQVTVAGAPQGSYSVASKNSARKSYAGLDNGPVKVTSTLPMVASERVAYSPDGGTTWTSHSEIMGLPINQLASSYTFPWYNNLDLNSQLRFGNVGTATTTVTVTIAGVFKGNYTLLPNESRRVSYPALDKGPVKITSSGNVPIIASMRVAYFNGTAWSDFSEMMGLPSSSLSTHYSFPVYDNVLHNSQLRFGNVGNVSTNVTVTINGVLKGTYTLAPNASQRISYLGLSAGPVVIQSSGNVPIIASERVAYFNGTAWTSFAEMMGLPQSQLSTTFLFPWYNNIDLNTQLRFGIP